jgi:hypothetical protein
MYIATIVRARLIEQLVQSECSSRYGFETFDTNWSLQGRSVPPGRPGPGVGVKKINVRPYSPPAKLKTGPATLPTAILGSHGCKKSKISVGSVAGPGSGYEQAVTSQTLIRARTARGIRARGIFLRKSLS